MNVFVAEGCEAVCGRLVQLVTEQRGFRVSGTATDAGSAVAALEAAPPDLLLLGVSLVEGSAFQVLRSLGERRWQMHIVLLCERLDAHYMYYARALGADYVLEQPRDLELIPELMVRQRLLVPPRLS